MAKPKLVQYASGAFSCTTGTHNCLVETLRTLSTETSTASSQDLDNLASTFNLTVDKGNAAALVSFVVFDAIADTKF
jgi:hypothetical protein